MPKSSAKVVQFEEKSSAPDLGKNKKICRKENLLLRIAAYETKNISNYKKHIKSKKHIKNEKILRKKMKMGKFSKVPKKMGKKVAQIIKYLNVNFVQKLVLVKQVIIDIIQYVTKIRLIKRKKDELLEKNKELEKSRII